MKSRIIVLLKSKELSPLLLPQPLSREVVSIRVSTPDRIRKIEKI